MKNTQNQLAEKVVHIGRVTKVVKGGRIFRFTATVVVGDMNGKVGIGYGKAREVADAIKKGVEAGKNNLVDIPLVKGTIPHEVIGKFCASEMVMKPAAPGTGIIAGGASRALFEVAGIKNILVKSLRSRNFHNSLLAVMNGFDSIRTLEQTANVRDVSIEDIIK